MTMVMPIEDPEVIIDDVELQPLQRLPKASPQTTAFVEPFRESLEAVVKGFEDREMSQLDLEKDLEDDPPQLSVELFSKDLDDHKDILEVTCPQFPKAYSVFKDDRYFPELQLVDTEVIRFVDGRETYICRVDISRLPTDKRKRFLLSVRYFLQNPHHPTNGTLCADLDTYIPKTDSQKIALRYAREFAKETSPVLAAGIVYHGASGTGKMHLIRGIGLKFLEQGWSVNYVSPHYGPRLEWTNVKINHGQGLIREERLMPVKPRDKQVWLFQNVNPANMGLVQGYFLDVCGYVIENGGRVLVTSGKEDFEGWFQQMFKRDGWTELQAWARRIDGFIKPYRIDGPNHREETAWFRTAWANIYNEAAGKK